MTDYTAAVFGGSGSEIVIHNLGIPASNRSMSKSFYIKIRIRIKKSKKRGFFENFSITLTSCRSEIEK
jgi:hypothetical protein